MSRAAQSKSRADKKGGPSAPTPAVTHEIVPGKYTDVDWNRMLEYDDGEDFVGEIVDELVAGTLGVIYQKYIERQLLPYTISQAKDALLTIIDWKFLTCDYGEADPSSDPSWAEDEEPSACVPDCWAQGSVPKTFVSTKPLLDTVPDTEADDLAEQTHEDDDAEVQLDEQEKPWEVTDEQVLSEPEAEQRDQPDEDTEKAEQKMEPTPPTDVKKKKRKFRPHKGPLRSAGVKNMHESLDVTERKAMMEAMKEEVVTDEGIQSYDPMPKSVGSILKFQSGRPPGNRDVYYDERGNIVAMSKINPEKLPTHRIRTKFHVIDPATEAAQARLDAMRTGKYLASKTKRSNLPSSDKTKLEKSHILDYRSAQSFGSAGARSKHTAAATTVTGRNGGKSTDPVTPLPPPMIESMELAPGVVVREGDRVKRGPRQLQRHADKLPGKDSLRPVGVDPDVTISVKTLLGNKTPLVRIESTPVPPIMSKQGMKNRQQIST